MKETNLKKDLILREKLALQRTHLANQSTLLAFLRSSMYFLVAGLSVQKLSGHEHVAIVEILLFIASALLLSIGVYNYFRNKKKIQDSEVHIGDYKLDYEKDS